MSDPSSEAKGSGGAPTSRFNLITIVRLALLVAPWIFIAYLFRDIDSVADAFGDASVAPFAGAIGLTVVVVAGAALLWSRLIAHLVRGSSEPPLLPLLQTFARSWLARYIPGKVWSYGARIVQTESGTVPRRIVASSLLLEFTYIIGTQTIVGISVLIGAGISIPLGVAAAVAGLWALVLLVPRLDDLTILLLKFWGRFLPSRWRSIGEDLQKAAGDDPGLGFRAGYMFAGAYLVAGLLGGLSFVLVVMSLENIGWGDVPLLIAGYNLSAVVGILVIFAPAGLGVREAVLAALVTPVVSGPVAASVAILMRVVVVAADLIFVGATEALLAGRGNRSPTATGPKEARE